MFLDLLVGLMPSYNLNNTTNAYYFSPVVKVDITPAKLQTKPEYPMRIIVPDSNIDISVLKGKINNGTWELNNFSALYAEGSSPISNQYGNTIIYAHARSGLFYNLKNLKLKDKLYVMGEKNLYEYIVTEVEKILPTQIDVLKKSGNHNLSLFTCEGYGDEYRLVIRAQKLSSIKLNEEVI